MTRIYSSSYAQKLKCLFQANLVKGRTCCPIKHDLGRALVCMISLLNSWSFKQDKSRVFRFVVQLLGSSYI